MIHLAIIVICFMLVVWLLYYVAKQLGAPAQFLNIAVAVICVLFLIWFLTQGVGAFEGGGLGYYHR
jgi:hypothetical protein